MSTTTTDYILSEEEEARLPDMDELHRRWTGLSEDEQQEFLEKVCDSEREMLGKLFATGELESFIKGRDTALAEIDAAVESGRDDFFTIRDRIWAERFRRDDFSEICNYGARIRIWGAPF